MGLEAVVVLWVFEAKSQSTDSWTSAPGPVGEWLAKDQVLAVAQQVEVRGQTDGPENLRAWVVAGERWLARPAIAAQP